jgi:hypothetical protein
MTLAQLKWIAGVVVALLVVWAGARLLRSGMDDRATGFRLTAVAADSADSVVVTGAETILVAKGAGGTWTANGFAGGAAAVHEFFAALADTTPAELVAQSAASFARLGMDSAAARRVRVWRGGQAVVDVLVSERGPDSRSAYARLPGDSAVYVLAGPLAAIARRQLDDWREKTIATVVPESVTVVELERRSRRVVLRKAEGGWLLGSARADSAAVQRLLERYRALSAAGFPTTGQRDSIFRGRLWRRALLRGAGGATLLALEFDSAAAGVWVRRPGAVRDSIYRINTWDADELVPVDSTFRPR